MAWEQRRNHHYYYRKRRQGRRVISEYLGLGDIARFQALAAQRDRRRRAQACRQALEARSEFEQLDQSLEALQSVTTTLVQATLIAEGFHLHRGQWRKTQRGRPHG